MPTYNERATIAEVVDRLSASSPVDVLVVDDSSPDGTAEIVRELARRDERIYLVERPDKHGLGTAYVTGFRWAIDNGYDVVVQMDGDLSHDPADVPRLIAGLDDADLVIGSRYVPGGSVANWGPLRRALSFGGNLYARICLGFSIRDSTSGFRAWRASWLRAQDLGSIRSEGYAFQVEMTRRTFRADRTIAEVPIVFTERLAGRSKMSRSIVLEALARVTAWGLKDRAASIGKFGALAVGGIIVLALIAGALRLVSLGEIPPGFNQDEAVNGYDAFSLWSTGRDHHGHPFPVAGLESFGDWASPLLTLVTAPVVGLFGLELETVRGVSALFGVLAVIAAYLAAKELLGGRAVALVAAAVVALSAWHVHLTRWAIPPGTVPTMVFFLIWALLRCARRRRSKDVVIAGVIVSLTIAAYPTMKVFVPLVVLAWIVIFQRAVRRLPRPAVQVAVGIVVVFAGPAMYLSAFDPAAGTRFDQLSIFKHLDITPSTLSHQYFSYLSPNFLFVNGDVNRMHSPGGFGLESPALVPLLGLGVVGLIWSVWRPGAITTKHTALLLLSAIALYPIPGALTIEAPQALRAAHAVPLMALLAATGVQGLIALFRSALSSARAPVKWGIAAVAACLILLPYASSLLERYRYYVSEFPDDGAVRFQYGLREAIDYALSQAGTYDEAWIWDANQAYIFVLFQRPWDPTEVHIGLDVIRGPPAFNSVARFDKYVFSELPAEDLARLDVLFTTEYATGEVAYEVRGGTRRDGVRVLAVHRP